MYYKKLIQVLILCFILSLAACLKKNFSTLPVFSHNNSVQVVVEIPAGTSHKIEYDAGEKEFLVDQKDGRDRIIDFLPYPANYGFIPSTYKDPARGGDGDPLDSLVIAESVPTGTVVEATPIAVLLLTDEKEIDSKIIAVPVDATQRVIKATTFQELNFRYPKVKEIIEDWFLNYKGKDVIELIGWEDERRAIMEIKMWMVE
jgi:inorganic pyrophosphatase